eukprot:jgi/Chlat1/8751/Chrsp9S08582
MDLRKGFLLADVHARVANIAIGASSSGDGGGGLDMLPAGVLARVCEADGDSDDNDNDDNDNYGRGGESSWRGARASAGRGGRRHRRARCGRGCAENSTPPLCRCKRFLALHTGNYIHNLN